MKPLTTLCLCTLLAYLILPIHSMYLYMEEGEKKCFAEEVPKDTMILANWSVSEIKGESEETLETKKTTIILTVKDPLQALIYQKNLALSARFGFTSQMGGEHIICFQSSTSSWFRKIRFKFRLALVTGGSASDWQDVASKEHLSVIETKLRKLSADVENMRSEQNYQRVREEAFSSTSESTNSMVFWWSFFQISVVCLVAYFQIRHLKLFFKKKKIV
eukprot:TRINITY_DN8078_c0_g1_i5.p1 TRINITY_DN8078_c0_g1~~TRINITY_DN8078_c0_g1_i5.p1  ORF type:complete len:239 (-),score=31.71 TRINITY_DN8078_c0_g1_i5:59-712(-)